MPPREKQQNILSCECQVSIALPGGRKHLYEIRLSDRLIQIVLALFQAEKDRHEQLISTIKTEIKKLKPHPYAAWIQAPPKEVGEPLTLGMLHETRHLTNCVQQLRARLNLVENDFDLTIEIEGYTKADIFDYTLDEVTVLYGVLPPTNSPARQLAAPLTHREKNRRLDAISRKLAKAIEQDSSLLLPASLQPTQTSQGKPWRIKTATTFTDWQKALDF